MINKAMEKRIAEGEAIDISNISDVTIGTSEKPVTFKFKPHVQDIMSVDYCHAPTESWIWSIGRSKETGVIYAAVDGRYYMNDKFECLWLR
jgi:hypothetical protein